MIRYNINFFVTKDMWRKGFWFGRLSVFSQSLSWVQSLGALVSQPALRISL